MKTKDKFPYNYDNYLKVCKMLDEYEPVPLAPLKKAKVKPTIKPVKAVKTPEED
jgi:hypothetical protein